MNNKGFAITSVIYGLSILGIMIVAILMGTLSASRHNVSEEAKAVEQFLINFNQTEITFRESTMYYVPADETGWYRIEAFGKGTASARGTYITGIVYLKEGWSLNIAINDNLTDVSVQGTTIITAPAANGSTPGGSNLCYDKASTGGFIDLDTFELKDTSKSLIGMNDVTLSSGGCITSFINGHPKHGTGTITYPLMDYLILPGAYSGNTGKVIIHRLAEHDDLTYTVPIKNKHFEKVKKITVDRGSSTIKVKGIYCTYEYSSTELNKVTMTGATSSSNVSSYSLPEAHDVYDIFILLEDGHERENLTGFTVTLETTTGNYIVYDSRDTLGVPVSSYGLHLSSFQPDSYTNNVLGSDNNFPVHGNYYMIPITSENMVVSGVLKSADVGNQLKIEPITGESRQKWSIDMINSPGSTNPNFPSITNQSGRKEYRIMELTRYKALNIYYDENSQMNFVAASETFNTLSRNNPQIWNIFPMKDTTFAIKTVVPSFTLSAKSGFLFAKTAGESNDNINDVLIGAASVSSQSNSDSNTLPTNVERFYLYSLDFSK